MKKRIFGILLAFAIILTIGGCKKGASPSELLDAAYENSASISNVTAKYSMKLDMSSADRTLNTATTADMAIIMDPYKLKMDIKADMGELGSQNMEMYMASDGDNHYIYSNISGTWYKQSLDKDSFEKSTNSYNIRTYLKAFVESKKSFEVYEAEEDGKKVCKLDGTLSGEALENMFSQTDILSQMESLGIDPSLYGDLGSVDVALDIDKETSNIQKMSLDMTAMMKQLMSEALKPSNETESPSVSGADNSTAADIDIEKCIMEIEYTGYNDAEDFEIPAEALNAEEITADGSNAE